MMLSVINLMISTNWLLNLGDNDLHDCSDLDYFYSLKFCILLLFMAKFVVMTKYGGNFCWCFSQVQTWFELKGPVSCVHMK